MGLGVAQMFGGQDSVGGAVRFPGVLGLWDVMIHGMDAQISIRPVVDSDFERWRPLWDGYNLHYERTVDADVTRTTWTRFLEPREPVHALVAEENGRLLGFAHFIFHRSTSVIAETCYLQDLFTLETARGRGIASALIDAVAGRAKAHGAARVYWQTHETNAVARSLYDRVAEYSGFLVYRKPV